MNLASLIEALTSAAAYGHPVWERVEVRQTHISVVFLAGAYVYKVKKPVNLGFLDFSTLQNRLECCQQEVQLNRRLAPHVYLGVVPVIQTPLGLRFEGQGELVEWAVKMRPSAACWTVSGHNEGEVVEWAVKMRRLPDSATLQERFRRGEVGVDLVETLAGRFASFHRSVETNERIATFGRFDSVAESILEIFEQAAQQVGITVNAAVLARVRDLAQDALARLRPLIERRAACRMTRDCHGDLRLDHVYFFPERKPPADVVVIDCIEFNERFRFIDPVADMAFLAMELAFHGRRDLARAFAEAYFNAASDHEGHLLLPLYAAYRAAVRARVEGLLLAEKEVPEADRAAALVRAKAHWLLALAELQGPRRKPCLLLVAGLPGSGKSRLAQGLADRAAFYIVRSDVVRKELAGLTEAEPTPGQARPSLYTAVWNDRTYAECLRRAERLLFEGKRVLVDATFREEKKRQLFLDTAVRWGLPGGLLHCHASPETLRQRLETRQGDASDADWAISRQMADSWEEFGPITRRLAYDLRTEGTPEEAQQQALEALRQWGLWD
jgi:hypothetical protein